MERRTFQQPLQVREDGSERLIEGLAVPYNTPAEIGPGLREQFTIGSVDVEGLVGRPFLYRHNEPVGVIRSASSTADGVRITAKIAGTSLGDDLLALAREGAIGGLSVGFDPVTDEWNTTRDLVTRIKTKVREVSAAVFPVYETAAITAVRETPTPQEEAVTESAPVETTAPADSALTELREQLAATREDINTLSAQVSSAPFMQIREGLPFQNETDYWTAYREAMFGTAEQRERFAAQTRALTDLDTGDTGSAARTNWADDIVRLVNKNRRTVDAIGTKPLPSQGLTVDYLVQSADVDTGDQASQLAEVTSGQYTSAAAQAAVFTEAGANRVSIQLIERSSPDFLTELMRDFAGSYAKRWNTRAITLLGTASATAGWTVTSGATTSDFGKFLADAVGDIVTAIGDTPDVCILGPQFFLTAATLSGYGYPLAGGNPGGADVTSLTFNAFGLQFVCDPQMTTTAGYMVHRDSVRLWESPGAPFTISNNVPANLGQEIAVYGYGAVALRRAGGVSKLTLTP